MIVDLNKYKIKSIVESDKHKTVTVDLLDLENETIVNIKDYVVLNGEEYIVTESRYPTFVSNISRDQVKFEEDIISEPDINNMVKIRTRNLHWL